MPPSDVPVFRANRNHMYCWFSLQTPASSAHMGGGDWNLYLTSRLLQGAPSPGSSLELPAHRYGLQVRRGKDRATYLLIPKSLTWPWHFNAYLLGVCQKLNYETNFICWSKSWQRKFRALEKSPLCLLASGISLSSLSLLKGWPQSLTAALLLQSPEAFCRIAHTGIKTIPLILQKLSLPLSLHRNISLQRFSRISLHNMQQKLPSNSLEGTKWFWRKCQIYCLFSSDCSMQSIRKYRLMLFSREQPSTHAQ